MELASYFLDSLEAWKGCQMVPMVVDYLLDMLEVW
jgi:hypothetical protein